MLLDFVGSVTLLCVIFVALGIFLILVLISYCNRHADEKFRVAMFKSAIKYAKIVGKFAIRCYSFVSPKIRTIVSIAWKKSHAKQTIQHLIAKRQEAKRRSKYLRELRKMREPLKPFMPVHIEETPVPTDLIERVQAQEPKNDDAEVIDLGLDLTEPTVIIAQDKAIDDVRPIWRIWDESTPNLGNEFPEYQWANIEQHYEEEDSRTVEIPFNCKFGTFIVNVLGPEVADEFQRIVDAGFWKEVENRLQAFIVIDCPPYANEVGSNIADHAEKQTIEIAAKIEAFVETAKVPEIKISIPVTKRVRIPQSAPANDKISDSEIDDLISSIDQTNAAQAEADQSGMKEPQESIVFITPNPEPMNMEVKHMNLLREIRKIVGMRLGKIAKKDDGEMREKLRQKVMALIDASIADDHKQAAKTRIETVGFLKQLLEAKNELLPMQIAIMKQDVGLIVKRAELSQQAFSGQLNSETMLVQFVEKPADKKAAGKKIEPVDGEITDFPAAAKTQLTLAVSSK